MDSLDTTVCFYCADQNPHRDRSRGISSYTSALMQTLQACGISIEAVVSKSSFPPPETVRCRTLPFRTDRAVGRLLSDHFHPLVPWGKDNGVAKRIWHYPKGFLPLPCQVSARRVGTIADLILPFYAEKYPASRHPFAFTYWLKLLKHSIEHFDAIVTVSDFSARAIRDFAQQHRLRCPAIVNTYEGVEAPRAQWSQLTKEDYVVHLCSVLPHKGTNWLLKTWRQFQESGGNVPALLLVGETDATADAMLSTMKRAKKLAPLPRPELETIIATARALILPSEIEGFGLPAVEAYFCGTPTAYVQGTAVEEVLGEGTPGAFEMSGDPDSLAQALAELLGMSQDQVQTQAAELRKRFSWEICVEKTLAVYRSVLA